MRCQDQIVRNTQRALDDVLRAVDAMPEDKVDWTPSETARSVFSQMQEIATSASWFMPIVRDRKVPEFDDHARREAVRLRKSFDSIAKCRDAAQSSTAELCMLISEFPEEHLEDEIVLPFGGGTVMPMIEVLGLHAWNLVYHLGQINYVQTILGDREMH